MTIGFLFWLLMILWLLFGIYFGYSNRDLRFVGGGLVLWLLLFLLGYAVFGWPIKG